MPSWPVAVVGLRLAERQHGLKLLLGEELHAQALGLVQLTASLLTHNQVVGLLADGTGGLGAQLQQLGLDAVAGVVLQLAGGDHDLAGKGVVLHILRHGIVLLQKCDVFQHRAPQLGLLGVVVPGIDVVMHDLPKVLQLGKVKAVPDGLLEGLPVATEVAVQDTPRMAAHLRDTQGGNKLVECAGTPLVDSLLEPGKGLLTKSGAGDDVVLMVFQHIEIPEVFDPTAFHKGFQRLLN